MVIAESNSVALVPVPKSDALPKAFAASFYRRVADAMLRGVIDCCRLFGSVPDSYRYSCWFLASGKYTEIDLEGVVPTDPTWADPIQPFVPPKPEDASDPLESVSQHWDKLRDVCGVEQVVATFASEKKGNGYLKAGNAEVKRRTANLARARAEELQSAGQPIPTFKAPRAISIKWFFEGFFRAYLKELEKVEERRRANASRLVRAFWIFADSFRVRDPYDYVALTICLETLLGHERTELTFQLASRTAWLLAPSDAKARSRFFRQIKDLYNFRGQIVHGSKYSVSTLTRKRASLLTIMRRVFEAILSNRSLFTAFAGTDSKSYDSMLHRISLGDVPDAPP